MAHEELMSHLKSGIDAFIRGSSGNYISMRAALSPSSAGLMLFNEPLIAVGDAHDALFEELAGSSADASQMRLPSSWLENATCVVSYFLPMTERVRESNYGGRPASTEWLHACVEGKMFTLRLGEHIERLVRAAGYEAVCPACHPEMEQARGAEGFRKTHHGSWSEYRAAYVCGLGTYALSGGFITEAGVAGRLGSVVVSAPLPLTQRPYSSLDEYCIKCGACVDRCPAGALSLTAAKNRRLCHAEMEVPTGLFPGYVGCGKCRVDVPCECGRP